METENLEQVTRKLKEYIPLLESTQKDLAKAEASLAVTKKLIEEKDIELKEVLSTISDQKLEWSQTKAKELTEIESKKTEINVILARSSYLDKREVEVNADLEEAKEARNETRQNILKVEQEKLVVENLKKEVETKRQEVLEKGVKNGNKIVEFKENLLRVIETVEQLNLWKK